MNLRPLLVFACLASPLAAQPTGGPLAGRPLETFTAGYSFSSKEDLERDGRAGAVSVQRYEVSLGGRHTLSEADTLSFGLAHAWTRLDREAGTPLPAELGELALNLGLTRRFSPQWLMSIMASPGIYGDFEEIDGKSFNAPLLVTAVNVRSADLAWLFGMRVNVYSDYPVLPIAGVRWRFAPEWTFEVGFPQSGFAWRAADGVTFRAGVSYQGGTYRITDSLGVPAPGVDRLANTFLDYREFRGGIGVELALDPRWSLMLDAGVLLDRRFDYYDRDYELDGSGGWFGALALRVKL